MTQVDHRSLQVPEGLAGERVDAALAHLREGKPLTPSIRYNAAQPATAPSLASRSWWPLPAAHSGSLGRWHSL